MSRLMAGQILGQGIHQGMGAASQGLTAGSAAIAGGLQREREAEREREENEKRMRAQMASETAKREEARKMAQMREGGQWDRQTRDLDTRLQIAGMRNQGRNQPASAVDQWRKATTRMRENTPAEMLTLFASDPSAQQRHHAGQYQGSWEQVAQAALAAPQSYGDLDSFIALGRQLVDDDRRRIETGGQGENPWAPYLLEQLESAAQGQGQAQTPASPGQAAALGPGGEGPPPVPSDNPFVRMPRDQLQQLADSIDAAVERGEMEQGEVDVLLARATQGDPQAVQAVMAIPSAGPRAVMDALGPLSDDAAGRMGMSPAGLDNARRMSGFSARPRAGAPSDPVTAQVPPTLARPVQQLGEEVPTPDPNSGPPQRSREWSEVSSRLGGAHPLARLIDTPAPSPTERLREWMSGLAGHGGGMEAIERDVRSSVAARPPASPPPSSDAIPTAPAEPPPEGEPIPPSPPEGVEPMTWEGSRILGKVGANLGLRATSHYRSPEKQQELIERHARGEGAYASPTSLHMKGSGLDFVPAEEGLSMEEAHERLKRDPVIRGLKQYAASKGKRVELIRHAGPDGRGDHIHLAADPDVLAEFAAEFRSPENSGVTPPVDEDTADLTAEPMSQPTGFWDRMFGRQLPTHRVTPGEYEEKRVGSIVDRDIQRRFDASRQAEEKRQKAEVDRNRSRQGGRP